MYDVLNGQRWVLEFIRKNRLAQTNQWLTTYNARDYSFEIMNMIIKKYKK